MQPLKAGIIAANAKLAAELHSSLQDMAVEILFEETDVNKADAALTRGNSLGMRLLFLDLSRPQQAFSLIRRTKSLNPAISVFALHEIAEPNAILEAMRAGVSEYLVPPFRSTLEIALQRVTASSESPVASLRAGGKVLGFVSAKGGCGATTLACHLARELPRLTGDKALLTDCDFDAGLVSFLFKTKTLYSLADAATNIHRLDASYWKAVVNNGVPGLDMIGAPAGASTQALTPEHLEKVLSFLKNQYGWVLADVGRGLNAFRMSVLTNCDDIYLVTTVEITALHHAQRTVTRLLESGFPQQRLHILLNRPPRQLDVSIAELEKMLGAEIAATIPTDEEVLAESYAEGTLAPPTSAIGRSIVALGRAIAGLQVEKQPKKRFSLFR